MSEAYHVTMTVKEPDGTPHALDLWADLIRRTVSAQLDDGPVSTVDLPSQEKEGET